MHAANWSYGSTSSLTSVCAVAIAALGLRSIIAISPNTGRPISVAEDVPCSAESVLRSNLPFQMPTEPCIRM